MREMPKVEIIRALTLDHKFLLFLPILILVLEVYPNIHQVHKFSTIYNHNNCIICLLRQLHTNAACRRNVKLLLFVWMSALWGTVVKECNESATPLDHFNEPSSTMRTVFRHYIHRLLLTHSIVQYANISASQFITIIQLHQLQRCIVCLFSVSCWWRRR